MANKILYFHSSIWHDYFRNLLTYYQKKKNYEVGILCGENLRNVYSENFESGADHFPIPDFKNTMEWEDNSDVHEKLKELVGECEALSATSTNRIILSGEREIGRAYSSKSYYWKSTALQKYCMENNQRSTLVILRMFKFLNDVYERFQPTLILARLSNPPLNFVGYLLSKKFNIPFLSCRFSKILDKRFYWTGDMCMYNGLVKIAFNNKYKRDEKSSSFANEFLISYRESPKTIHYIQENWKRGDLSTWAQQHLKILSLSIGSLIYILKGSKGPPPKSGLQKFIEYYRIKWAESRHNRFYSKFTENELKDLKYIYYPLHKEPELNLNFHSPLWHDQKHTVSYISCMLPSGYKFLVREHRYNWGRRYTEFLKLLTQLPNVVLIDPFDPQFKYIQNANLIITGNGSSGWEGLLLNRPVITFEKTFYEDSGLNYRITNPSILDKEILKILKEPLPYSKEESERRIGLLVDAEYETTLSEDEKESDPGVSAQYIERLLDIDRQT